MIEWNWFHQFITGVYVAKCHVVRCDTTCSCKSIPRFLHMILAVAIQQFQSCGSFSYGKPFGTCWYDDVSMEIYRQKTTSKTTSKSHFSLQKLIIKIGPSNILLIIFGPPFGQNKMMMFESSFPADLLANDRRCFGNINQKIGDLLKW